MDILPTQVYEDDDAITPTQKFSHSSQHKATQEIQIGTLSIGSKSYPVKKGINKIGRHPQCNIILSDDMQSVSRKHAEIEVTNGEAWLCDLDSANKTKLNSSVLRPGRFYELKSGSVIEFGLVRAVYTVNRSLDESLVPETPAPNHLRKSQTVILETPNSSMCNASTSKENISMIPETQPDDEVSVFRRPSAPLKSFNNSRRKSVPNSYIDDSINDSGSSFMLEKEHVDEGTVSIHDMETYRQNETSIDIHDVETQKILHSSEHCHNQTDIHDMETQHEEDIDVQHITTNIHDVETQHDIDSHDVKPQRIIESRNVSAVDEKSVRVTEKCETRETELQNNISGIDTKKSEIEEGKACTDAAVQSRKAAVTKTNDSADIEKSENDQKCSQEYLQLSLTTNFDDECSEFNRSHNFLDSQNLLEDFIGDDDPVNESKSKSSTPLKSSNMKNNETTENNSSDENIFNAATQVKVKEEYIFNNVAQRADYMFKASLLENDSDDDTDQEGVFQRYSRVDSQDSSQDNKFSKSQSNSEDSDTDEEGRFIEIAKKEKQSASSSFEARQNNNEGDKSNPGSSRASYDLFDVPTQQLNLKNQISSERQSKNNEDINFNAPNQIIKLNSPKSDVNIGNKEEHIDNLQPTQILLNNDTIECVENKKDDQIEYNVPTQIISENVSISNDQSPKNSVQLNPNTVEEFSIEDIDYEMAPTQLITDVGEQNSKSISPEKKRLRNLNKMFHDLSGDIKDQSQISMQVLTDMLQLSQSDEKSVDNNVKKILPESSKNIKSTKERKSDELVTNLESPLLSNKKLRRWSSKQTTSDNDSQNYFSNLTSRRKLNVWKDSQDFDIPSENLSDNKNKLATKLINNNITNDKKIVSDTSMKSTPKGSPRTRFSRTRNTEDPKEFEAILEKTNLSNSNENVLKGSTNNDQAFIATVQTGQPEKAITTLESDEEDIMAGLPEFRISGTLSNPESPTSSASSEFRLHTSHLKSKQDSRRIESKKKNVRKKSTRKSFRRTKSKNDESHNNNNKSSSAATSTVFDKFNVTRVPVTIHETDKVKVDETTPMIRTSSRKSKENKSWQRKSNLLGVSQEHIKDSPSIQTNGRTRSSSKENVDCSSIFQVSKEAPIAKEATDSSKQTTLRASRAVKRSLSTTDESKKAKKLKGNINESAFIVTKGGKGSARSGTVNRSNSANILNYVTKRNSPANVEESKNSQQSFNSSQENANSKQLIIKIMKLSSSIPMPSLSSSLSTKSITESGQNEKTRNRRTSTNNHSVINNSSNVEHNKTVTKRNNSKRTTNKRQPIAENLSSEVGEESQEVEMIMNASLKQQSFNLNEKNKKTTNQDVSNTKTRNTRKRGYANVHTSEDIIENTSSDIHETDNTHFEMPTSKAKRAKVSKNATNIVNSSVNESTKRGRRSSKQSSQSIRDLQQSITDSSLEEVADTNVNKRTVNNIVSKENNVLKKRESKPKAQKLETEKKKNEDAVEETSSEINSSVDTSVLSTPTRGRKNLSTSFTTSSPYKIKHKVLFTGISNDYNKLLTKLGSSQVEDPTKCSVLVTDKIRRTVKFLCALAQAVPIVSVDWLADSEKAGRFTELDSYILKDPASEAKFGFKLRGSLEKARKQKLLNGYTILLTPNVAPPSLPELKSIISSCGGKPLIRPPSSWPQNAVIISREEDLENAKKFLMRAPKTVTVQSTEFLLTGILRQELDFVKYKLT